MKKRSIIILVILLVVGFASITTTLVINGKVGVGVNLDDFDVIFIEALLDTKTSNKVIISENKKTITFNTDKLINVGDTSRLDYKVKNVSTQYNADVLINCSNEASEYINVTTLFDGNTLPLDNSVNIGAQEIKNGYINAELVKPYSGDDTSIEIKCDIIVTATSRETYAYSLIFDSNGGTIIDDKSVTLNENFGELEVPKKEGYTFLGWYDESDNQVDSTTVLDSKGNKNLTARWEKTIYDLNVVISKNGKNTTNKLDITYGDTVTIKVNENNYYISSMNCSDGYSIENYDLVIPTYGEQTIDINNNKSEKNGTCTFNLAQGIFEYNYTGSVQEFVVPLNGNYKVELWGATGAIENRHSAVTTGGAYTSGEIELIKNSKFYVYVGERGKNYDRSDVDFSQLTFAGTRNGFNGGGKGNRQCGDGSYYGGIGVAAGATDIRTINGAWNNANSLRSRIMVAAASGGTTYSSTGVDSVGGPGGGLLGYSGTRQAYGTGATQTSGGSSNGTFGSGGNAKWTAVACDVDEAAGGSGGWYGGGGATAKGSYTYSSGGSGSSYISGHAGCIAVTSSTDTTPKCVSNSTSIDCSKSWTNYYFNNTLMIDGAGYQWTTEKKDFMGMPTHEGTGTMIGNVGNGYAKITYLGD